MKDFKQECQEEIRKLIKIIIRFQKKENKWKRWNASQKKFLMQIDNLTEDFSERFLEEFREKYQKKKCETILSKSL